MIRLGLRLQGEVLFIPKTKPWYNGAVEQFKGWFQPLLLARPSRRPAEARRQVQPLMTTVNEHHVHVPLGHQTAAAYRRGKALRKLPADCQLHREKLPLAVGKVSFIRLVHSTGTVKVLDQPFKVGRRLKFQYIKATLYTKEQVLKIYPQGRLGAQVEYKLAVK